ncbi:odorant receptor 46a-like [Musca vetustissima]|uniref:odorant receptor 46a-like n=1 Tax=Musca vetustissima TaxID=27455 RepID=UPI002AB686A4|nr:odorant receptor 46a-like [Musca vetustissima]
MNSHEHREALETFYKKQSWIFRLFAQLKLSDSASERFRLLHRIYFYYILICWVLSFDLSCLIQFISNITDLNEVIKVFYIFATAMGVFAKFMTIKLKNNLYAELIEIMHDPKYRPVNTREVLLFRQSQSLARTVRNFYTTISLCALNALLFTQYIIDTSQLPMSIYNPFNTDTKLRYVLVYIYQYCAVSVCCYTNIAFDSISASFMIHAKGQLDILCDRLEHLGTDYESSDANIAVQLKNCVKYYSDIIRIVKIAEELISLPISVQIACSVLVLVANFYAMSFLSDFANFIKFLIYQLCMLSQIYILLYFPSEVTAKSEEVPYYLYCSKWANWNPSNRKLTLLMMTRFDIPIRVKSINPTYTFNLAAFTSIVNCSYSYYALLKRINN